MSNFDFLYRYHEIMNNEDVPDGGNSMSYKLFKNGGFISMWDLTTDSAGLEVLYPTIRAGQVKVKVHFSEQTREPINMLVFWESKNNITIDKDNSISTVIP